MRMKPRNEVSCERICLFVSCLYTPSRKPQQSSSSSSCRGLYPWASVEILAARQIQHVRHFSICLMSGVFGATCDHHFKRQRTSLSSNVMATVKIMCFVFDIVVHGAWCVCAVYHVRALVCVCACLYVCVCVCACVSECV